MNSKLEEDILLLVGQGEMNTTQIIKATGKTKGVVRGALDKLVSKKQLFTQKRMARKAKESWFSLKPVKQVKPNYNLILISKWV